MTALDFEPDVALSFWPTPPEVAHDLVYWALMPWHARGEGVRVLEPSAGDGHLAEVARSLLPEAHITCVEPHPARAERLRTRAGVADVVVESMLEDYLMLVAWAAMAGEFTPYDLVVMNPPFTLPSRPEAWAEHILAIHDDPYLVAPGGGISAVVPRIVMTGGSPRVRRVRGLVETHGLQECERGAFASVGAQVSIARILIEASS